MTKREARRLIRDIEVSSSRDLQNVLEYINSASRRRRIGGAAIGGGIGAVAGAMSGGTPGQSLARAALGGILGGGLGLGVGALGGRTERSILYNEMKRRKGEKISKLLDQLADSARKGLENAHQGIQTKDTEYGVFASGRGVYSGDDKLTIKKDKDGNPVLSLLFAGINSSVEDGGPASAKSPFAARFYNKNRALFSDVQANTIFDDPIVADAYIDKIVSKIMTSRAKNGKYPKIRLVGYSAGGRGVVNFLKKMRERDPNFKVDEIVGIDPYQRPWETVPSELSDKDNPVADKIVYSRLADNYTGSRRRGLGHLVDTASNTFVSLAGKKLNGLAANTVVENRIPGIAHTDADILYGSALDILADMKTRNNKNNKRNRK